MFYKICLKIIFIRGFFINLRKNWDTLSIKRIYILCQLSKYEYIILMIIGKKCKFNIFQTVLGMNQNQFPARVLQLRDSTIWNKRSEHLKLEENMIEMMQKGCNMLNFHYYRNIASFKILCDKNIRRYENSFKSVFSNTNKN